MGVGSSASYRRANPRPASVLHPRWGVGAVEHEAGHLHIPAHAWEVTRE